MTRWVGIAGSVVVSIVVLMVAVALPAQAHVRSTPGFATLIGGGGDVELQLSLDYDLLARAVGLGSAALDVGDDLDRVAAFQADRDVIEKYLDERVVLYLDEAACDMTLGGIAVEQRQDVAYARFDIGYTCAGPADGRYRLVYDVFSPTDAVVDDHSVTLDYRLAGDEGRVVVDRAHASVTLGETNVFALAGRFGVMGVEHILFGLDHVLFVIALLIGARGLRDVLTVASVFTGAHSVTLALAALGWVHVPASVVEPLIALSIAYVALENLLEGGRSRGRLAVVFAFGLLHGLGFAGSIRVSDDLSWNLVASLLTFNIGIELGQALLIAVVVPLLEIARRRITWTPAFQTAVTMAVAGFGFIWFFERIPLTT